jgi:dipeptide/tripeptide permease
MMETFLCLAAGMLALVLFGFWIGYLLGYGIAYRDVNRELDKYPLFDRAVAQKGEHQKKEPSEFEKQVLETAKELGHILRNERTV